MKITDTKKTKYKIIISLLTLTISSSSLSCSLHYQNTEQAQEKIPEFTFSNVVYSTYENNQKTVELQSSRLEQFNYTGFSYAKDASFTKWDDNGKVDTKGNCDFLSMDTKNNIFSLYNNISVESLSNNIFIQADNLKWNESTEQLTSDSNSTVLIQQDNVSMTGQGFSASGVSREFKFKTNVIGSIIEEEEE